MKHLLATLLTTLFLTGAAWVDLDVDEVSVLTQKIDVDGNDGKPYVVPAGTEVRLVERYPLVLNAWLYRFEREMCEDIGRTVDLLLVEHNEVGYEYGVEIEENCALNIFLVTEDLYSDSIAAPKK